METQTAAAPVKAPSAVFPGIKGIAIDETAIKAHVMQPPQVTNIISSRGLEEGVQNHVFRFPPAAAYHLDVNGFGHALHHAIKNEVAGYVIRLRQNGKTIYTLEWNFAKEPVDGAEGWNPDVRMHVASCSKLITAMAMTKLLNDKRMSYDTPIISQLRTTGPRDRTSTGSPSAI